MIPQSVRERADAWWARDFRCEPHALRSPHTRVQQHAGRMLGASGIWILVVDGCPNISLPPALASQLGDRAKTWTNELVVDSSALRAALDRLPVEDIIGPAYIGYGTRETLRLAPNGAREYTSADAGAVRELRSACSELEWEHGGSESDKARVFGIADADGSLHAVAGYQRWNDLAHISVVTRPVARGRGFGSAVVSLAARQALDEGLLPQYRTLRANSPSMKIAQRLGFEEYGFSVYVRLTTP
jgi:GNAT superfamily N-acetyltransferase